MKIKMEIGCEAKHILTGEIGILTGRSESLNGTVQYSIKRNELDKDGKPFDERWVDLGILERIGDGLIGKIIIAKPTVTDIKLGMTVKHFSGFTGTVQEMVFYFNGCVHMGIMPNTDDKNKYPDIQYIPVQYLEILSDIELIESAIDSNGGPASSAPLMM